MAVAGYITTRWNYGEQKAQNLLKSILGKLRNISGLLQWLYFFFDQAAGDQSLHGVSTFLLKINQFLGLYSMLITNLAV